MKKIQFCICLMICCLSNLNAQNKETEMADKLFSQFEYVDAATSYLKLVKNGKSTPYVYGRLAESYYNVFNTKEAAKWYAKAVESKQDAETYYRYAQMLKAEGRYEDSNKQMQIFAKMAPSDQRAVAFNSDPNYLPKLKSQTKLYDEKILSINSDLSDFGAVLTNNNMLYFVSARNLSKKKYGRNEEPYLDLYQAVMNSDGSFAEPNAVSEINTRWHEGPASISSDGNTMYFSSESFNEKEFEKDNKNRLQKSQNYLYKATKDGDKWGNVKELPFNSSKYSNGHPSLTKDGKTLYFASNMKGSIGGIDIWKVAVNNDGTYGKPENLGKKVNTEGNENFPYITEDNRLFFASDGRKGFGALDVFMIDLGKQTDAINVGQPINSAKDDFAFTFNVAKNIGFFSSNKAGDDNIYQAIPICGVEIITTVKDAKTGNLLSNAKVSILDDRKNVVESKTSDDNGMVYYSVDCNLAYSLLVSKDGYESNTFSVAKSAGGEVKIPADLQPIDNLVDGERVALKSINFEYNKSNITNEGAFELDKLVQVMNKYPKLVIMVKSHTDNRGSDTYNLALSDSRAKSTVQYILSKGISKARISGKGYGESEPKINCGEDCTDEQHAANRRSEFLIVK